MQLGVYQAIRGSRIQALRFDIITNNLANVDTPGFKKDKLSFDEFLQEHVRADLSQGNMSYTGNPLDLALEGDGFFKVKTPNGIRYTRNGSFCLNADSILVTQNGDPVLGENGVIFIQGNDIVINTRGQVTVDETVVDTLSAATFVRPELLQKEGLSYYIYQGNQKEIITPEKVFFRQGYLERSNVGVVEEMTKMIETLRTYEAYQRILQTFDETSHKSVNEVGRVQ
ncbi:MAG: flagellar hook-basal body protein [Deltaproteobacteria bacterium]|nr:flagellar hook-basal body protein [Deltaproteobacteria bacterium]MBW2019129.1 flagellar hook-basal body protein [Deltaproteobacteria bacterium]MBW2073196.1 flagellar hook-basal body protein [Deltaproteobacteria bacterium]